LACTFVQPAGWFRATAGSDVQAIKHRLKLRLFMLLFCTTYRRRQSDSTCLAQWAGEMILASSPKSEVGTLIDTEAHSGHVDRDGRVAVGAFLRQEYDALCRYMYRMVGSRDDAVELVQDACLRFYENPAEPSEAGQNARARLFRIARNLAIDLLRKREVRRRYDSEVERTNVLVLTRDNPEQRLLKIERRDLIEAVFKKMDERQKDCLLLRGSGRSYSEIAAVLGLSPESVGPTLGRALRKFRTMYEELAGPPVPLQNHESAQRR
jgi:RNA polymerase sigma factor (sigma-70 family)